MHQQVQQRSAFQTAVSQSDQPQSGALGAQAEAFQFTSDDNSDVDDDDVDSTPSATATESVTAAAATATRGSDIIMRVVCLIVPRSGVARSLRTFSFPLQFRQTCPIAVLSAKH